MSFLNLAKQRYSCRDYLDKPVETEKIGLILEAGRVAPTAANRQPQKILVTQSEARREALKKACTFYNAPVVCIVCADRTRAWLRKSDQFQSIDVDASIVTDHMMLQATELSLGSLWICAFKPSVLRQEFSIPENLIPVNLLAIGYPASPPASPERHRETRLPLDETVVFID